MPVTKHTPGPWIPARKANCTSCRHPAILRDGGQVATATWQGSEAATDANARLIAAAPELLEALQEMVAGDAEAIAEADALGVPFPGEMLTAYRRAVAAISKATGGAPCL